MSMPNNPAETYIVAVCFRVSTRCVYEIAHYRIDAECTQVDPADPASPAACSFSDCQHRRAAATAAVRLHLYQTYCIDERLRNVAAVHVVDLSSDQFEDSFIDLDPILNPAFKA